MKKYFNFKDKRAITLTVIAIVTLLSLLVGATYAYFIASENNLATTRTLEVTTNNTTSVVATGNTTLTMDLNLDDMRKFGTTKTYYATKEGKTETETEEAFINIQSTSSTDIYCSYTAILTKNDTENSSNMIDQIIANGKEEEMVLSFLYNGEVKNTFDMKTAVWNENNQIQFTGLLTDIDPNGTAVLDAKLYLKNLSDVDQAPYLASSTLNLNMQLVKVNCDTMDTPMITNLAINTEKPNMLNVTMNEGAYELSSYCIDQVEKSTGECENWVSNNEKDFSIDLATYGNETNQTYYLHVKDIRGYIADSVGFDLSSSIFSITKDFEYKAEAQRYDIIADGTYKLEVWGAQGGYRSSSGNGGKGGYSSGVVYLQSGDTLYAYTGGAGNTGGTAGGFNGGGQRCGYSGGGGGTDIRINEDSLYARVIVAGGGASDGSSYNPGMYAGGVAGASATQNYGSGGGGASQTAGNSFGVGGYGNCGSREYAGAGGGGWYGGYGSSPDGSGDDDRGGGGGSGWVYTESAYNTWKSGNATDANKYLLSSKYYLEAEGLQLLAGNQAFTSPTGTAETGHTGNGYARITSVQASIVTATLY